MPSKRFTKINIDKETKSLVSLLAAGRGVSETTMLEQMILFYLLRKSD